MGRPGFKERVRRDILKARGLERSRYSGVRPATKVEIQARPRHSKSDPRKTSLMLAIEELMGMSMEELLEMEGSLSDVAEVIGIERTTVLKWRRRLGLDGQQPSKS